jgi:hypothetical protein
MKTNPLKQVCLLTILFTLFMNSSDYGMARPTKAIIKSRTIVFNISRVNPAISPFMQQSKRYNFGELRSGDCVMQAGGTLDIYSDGRAVFNATVWTNHTHSGDTWQHHIYFTNAAGAVIFQITLDGPNHMNDDGTHYAFSSSFNFPAELFDAVNTISVRGDC